MNLRKGKVKIPKKYEYMIEELQIESMEYVLILKDGYEYPELPNQKKIVVFTVEELLKRVRKLKRKEEY